MKPKPFIKWVGGKGRVYRLLKPYFPDMTKIRKYVEPFLGGGGMFFQIIHEYGEQLEEVTLSDNNFDLMLCYDVIKRYAAALCEELYLLKKEYDDADSKGKEKLFYAVRNRFNEGRTTTIYRNPYHTGENIGRVRDLIFLNKATFNGLYRVNKDGDYNAPWGHRTEISLFQEDNIMACGKVLEGVWVHTLPYEDILRCERSGSRGSWDKNTFVYLDPPYFEEYCSYNSEGFNKRHYRGLAMCGERMRKTKGVKVMCSMTFHPEMSMLFRKHKWKGYTIFVQKMIAADKNSRRLGREYVFTTYRLPKAKQITIPYGN